MNKKIYQRNKHDILNAKGNDSIFTLYLSTDLSSDYYSEKCSEHTFFTPQKAGLSTIRLSIEALLLEADKKNDDEKKDLLFNWLKEYAQKTTYEISIPVLRDTTLAPKNQSGLIISTVFDYSLSVYLKTNGLYKAFKRILSAEIIDVLSNAIFPTLKDHIITYFSSTPVTIQSRLNNTDGAITGWSFASKSPVEDRMQKIAKSVNTPFKDVYQSGHWVFSPSGLPTAVITAKLAVNKMLK
jgi:phytoene dehydrogenase-like protein